RVQQSVAESQEASGLLQLGAPFPKHSNPLQRRELLEYLRLTAQDEHPRFVEVRGGILAWTACHRVGSKLSVVNRGLERREMQPNQRAEQIMKGVRASGDALRPSQQAVEAPRGEQLFSILRGEVEPRRNHIR